MKRRFDRRYEGITRKIKKIYIYIDINEIIITNKKRNTSDLLMLNIIMNIVPLSYFINRSFDFFFPKKKRSIIVK